MPQPPVPPPPATPNSASGFNIPGRVDGLTKVVVTVTDHLHRLDKADAKTEERIDKLTERMVVLANVVSELSGQMRGIEKRLEEKDAHVRTTIELELLKAIEILRRSSAPPSGA